MRLQLACVATVLMLSFCARTVSAQDAEPGEGDATARLLVYSDDDATSVVTSVIEAKAAVLKQLEMSAHVLVDAVSSASVDVVSAATGRWDENRVELGASADLSLPAVNLSLGYTRSQENDWLSHSFVVGGNKELFQKNTVVSGFYSFTSNTVGRASDPTFERSLTAHTGELGVSQLLDLRTRVGASYTLQYLTGFLSSPYRYVRATDGTSVPERHPDTRTRHALSLSAIRSLASYLSLRAAYRIYVDDWGLRSQTLMLRLAAEPHERVLVGIEARGYGQNRADFYRDSYPTSFRFMSHDRELATFLDFGGFADVAVSMGPVTADAKAGVIHYRFDNFSELPKRTALLVGGGVKVVW